MNYLSHLIRFLPNSWLKKSSGTQSGCGVGDELMTERGATLGEEGLGSVGARELGEVWGRGSIQRPHAA